MSYWLSSLLLQPIDTLNETLDKINSNDDEGKALSEVRVPVVSKDDELAELTVLFNRMLDRMHRYVEQQQHLSAMFRMNCGHRLPLFKVI